MHGVDRLGGDSANRGCPWLHLAMESQPPVVWSDESHLVPLWYSSFGDRTWKTPTLKKSCCVELFTLSVDVIGCENPWAETAKAEWWSCTLSWHQLTEQHCETHRATLWARQTWTGDHDKKWETWKSVSWTNALRSFVLNGDVLTNSIS